MALKNQISSFQNNSVVVDFGNGVIVNINDFASGSDTLDIKFNSNFSEPEVGVTGVASFRQLHDPTATLTLKLKEESNENDFFRKWVINAENGKLDLINATVVNAVRGEKIILTSGIIKEMPSYSEGSNIQDLTWSIIFLKHTKNLI